MQTFVDAGVQAADADDTPGQRLKKVRVGYLIYPGYQEGEGNAPKSGYSPYYFGVSKKSPELYAELKNAITKILQSDWYYNEKVYLKYNGKTSPAATLIPAIEIIRRSVPFPG